MTEAATSIGRINREGSLPPGDPAGSLVVRARGASMHPRVRDRDWLVVAPGARVAVGDVAVFRTASGLVAHRVVTLHPPRQMGDAAWIAQGFDPAGVVGRVVCVVGEGRPVNLTGRAARLAGHARAIRSLSRLLLTKLIGPPATGAARRRGRNS